ncbi:UvrB/UvrC motif-containing protein [Sphingomonas abaci]|uniref:UVR domain-containing protein n=1 Tax=Sphingomonas abaci TaxID=237611 RepID=A0A7W7EW37_9SPHN|nr:UvrB/UvrC motif-containing protein [Sphingomonas abaci]MBB4616128.1 hypothetical protein [Sphingomonas abaci]
MDDTIQTLQAKMEAAALALDFERASRLRDQIALMRGGASAEEARAASDAGLTRQRPGAMGLGTSQQRPAPPPGWTPPPRPDLNTRSTGRRR